MAGRGTDIILGGNPEFMAKQAMRRKGLSEEEMAQVDSHEDTKDTEVLKNRNCLLYTSDAADDAPRV